MIDRVVETLLVFSLVMLIIGVGLRLRRLTSKPDTVGEEQG